MLNIIKTILKSVLKLFSYLIEPIFLLLFFLLTSPLIFFRNKQTKKSVLWGVDPIINNIYWAESLKNKIHRSDSVINYSYDSFIAKNSDYDFNVEFYFIKFPQIRVEFFLRLYAIINSIFIYYRYNIFVISFNGGPLNKTLIGVFEVAWAKICNKKIIVIPFGSDSYVYSEIEDRSLQHVLLTSQNGHIKDIEKIKRRKKFLFKWIDFYPATFQDDFVPFWSFTRPSFLALDLERFKPREKLERNKIVIAHAPNHRGFKGTAFIEEVIDELIDDGYEIEFKLLEGIPNNKISRVLSEEVDILVDQVIFQGYALNAIEGMASGIPVIANLEDSNLVRFFKRFSFLSECPIISANPENLKLRLIDLIQDQERIKELGKLGRSYVEKYHSFESVGGDWELVFDSLYSKESILNRHFRLREYLEDE